MFSFAFFPEFSYLFSYAPDFANAMRWILRVCMRLILQIGMRWILQMAVRLILHGFVGETGVFGVFSGGF